MTPESHREVAVALMRETIAKVTGPSWEAKRIRHLEAAIRRFCEFNVDTNATLGMPRDWMTEFQALADSIDFDPEGHAAEGFDREDV